MAFICLNYFAHLVVCKLRCTEQYDIDRYAMSKTTSHNLLCLYSRMLFKIEQIHFGTTTFKNFSCRFGPEQCLLQSAVKKIKSLTLKVYKSCEMWSHTCTVRSIRTLSQLADDERCRTDSVADRREMSEYASWPMDCTFGVPSVCAAAAWRAGNC